MNDKRDRDLFARPAPHKFLDVLDELTWATGRTKFMNLKSEKILTISNEGIGKTLP